MNNSETNYDTLITNDDDEHIDKPIKISKKKYAGCGIVILFVSLLCFFLIPRNPRISLNYIYLDNNGNGYGNFKLINKNFYKETWRDPDISLYWIPYDGQVVGEKCYSSNNPCNKYINNRCAIKLGEFKNSDHYNTKMRSSKHKNIELLSVTDNEIACTSWMLLNPYENLKQILVTTGTINVKNMMNNNKKHISSKYYYFD
tara:strand:- start:76 stop:678 length:603 start_codon:yes stop_codon:yes gene_type:complete